MFLNVISKIIPVGSSKQKPFISLQQLQSKGWHFSEKVLSTIPHAHDRPNTVVTNTLELDKSVICKSGTLAQGTDDEVK